MSNTCVNALKLSGPRQTRDGFIADISADLEYGFLETHVPVPEGAHPAEVWGTTGIKGPISLKSDSPESEICFRTHWRPPLLWLEQVAQLFPALKFELYCSSIEGVFGGYARADNGELETVDHCKSEFAEFFEVRGWPGFFLPFWEQPGFVWPGQEGADETEIASAEAATTLPADDGAGPPF